MVLVLLGMILVIMEAVARHFFLRANFIKRGASDTYTEHLPYGHQEDHRGH